MRLPIHDPHISQLLGANTSIALDKTRDYPTISLVPQELILHFTDGKEDETAPLTQIEYIKPKTINVSNPILPLQLNWDLTLEDVKKTLGNNWEVKPLTDKEKLRKAYTTYQFINKNDTSDIGKKVDHFNVDFSRKSGKLSRIIFTSLN